MNNSNARILDFSEIDTTKLALAGGKGANLGELTRIEGIQVPGGFCISTEVYKEVTAHHEAFHALLDQLELLKADDRKGIGETSAKIREVIEGIAIPEGLVHALRAYLEQMGAKACAVRSSATAEDLPAASFAGQQDTYLNIIGEDAILQHISRCWASLYTDRAVIYRMQNGFGHRNVYLSVVVQEMVFPQVSGILFTADPVTGNRKVVCIDAGFGLGEALVSGLVNADHYKVYNGRITDKKIPAKKRAVYAVKDGGTKTEELLPDQQYRQALADEQILELERTGRKIEAHFGSPQDIEWCLVDATFYIVQSRPITTLYPIPETNDQENHVYLSVGHQQMMTDPMKPLGLSLWQLRAVRPMFKAGGRLFVDIAASLATTAGQKSMIAAMGQHDPLIKDALMTLVERGDFIQTLPDDKEDAGPIKSRTGKSSADILAQMESNPVVVADLIRQSEASVAELQRNIQTKSGPALFDFILEDNEQSKKSLFSKQNMAAIMAVIDASTWINEKMKMWLGEKNAADTLSQSVPDNVTSEMGLALLDVADVIRPYPGIIAYLQQVKEDNFLDKLAALEGGQQVRDVIDAFLHKYGMRCAGEIDITRTRWREKPIILVPLILSNIKNLEPGAGKRKFEQGLQEALKKEQELSDRLKLLPDGEQKALETKQMTGLLRSFAGYREYPKYSIVSRLFVYKQALLKEAERLVQANVIPEKEDSYYLTFEELREVVHTHKLDSRIISKRKEEHKTCEKLHPPRVITSDGEIITGKYKEEDLPAGAIAGLAVSSGIVEGRARVILNIEDADLEAGDILVTSFTDPSWTPLFVSIKGLVAEVGGLMTHGAVIAREYGLPAVVGVENATRLIKDGQRIRVHGTDGYVEIL